MVRGILGHFHQGCHILQPYNGMQCTAIAPIALFAFMKSPDQAYVSRDLDEILVEGTFLYRTLLNQQVRRVI